MHIFVRKIAFRTRTVFVSGYETHARLGRAAEICPNWYCLADFSSLLRMEV